MGGGLSESSLLGEYFNTSLNVIVPSSEKIYLIIYSLARKRELASVQGDGEDVDPIEAERALFIYFLNLQLVWRGNFVSSKTFLISLRRDKTRRSRKVDMELHSAEKQSVSVTKLSMN